MFLDEYFVSMQRAWFDLERPVYVYILGSYVDEKRQIKLISGFHTTVLKIQAKI